MAERNDRVAIIGAAELHEPPFADILDRGAIFVDGVVIVAAALLSRLAYETATGVHVDQSVYLGAALLLSVIFTLLIHSRSEYENERLLSFDRQVRSAMACWSIAFGLSVAVGFMLKASADLSRGAVFLFLVSGLVALVARRALWRVMLARAMSIGYIRTRKVILIGSGDFRPSALQLGALERSGIEVVKSTALPVDTVARKAALDHLVASIRRNPVDEVIVALTGNQVGELDLIAEHLRSTPVPLRMMPDLQLSRLARQKVRGVGPFALIDITRAPLSPGELAWKRACDIAISASALVVVAPLMMIAFVAIRLDTPGPVLFRQSRRGFNGQMFKILKLRTMTVMDDGEHVVQARRRDPRVTRVGSWLRRTSIDELPQLWNVIRGEMSIVGPRPHAVAHDNYYDDLIENYAFRQHVKPGLTGWAQVNGLRGETPDVAVMAARVDHDVWYVSNWSIFLDLRIILKTATKLFSRGVY